MRFLVDAQLPPALARWLLGDPLAFDWAWTVALAQLRAVLPDDAENEEVGA